MFWEVNMDSAGLIHEELDYKILILYIIRRMPAPIEAEQLFDLCLCDNGVEYFDFAEYLNDLIASGHISQTDDGLVITEKGSRNVDAVESSLPYSVRRAADKAIVPAADELARFELIRTSYEKTADGSCFVHLSMSDGTADLIDMKLYCAGEKQARLIKKNFRRKAEKYYNEIITLVSEDNERKLRR